MLILIIFSLLLLDLKFKLSSYTNKEANSNFR